MNGLPFTSVAEFHMILNVPRLGCLCCTTWLPVATLLGRSAQSRTHHTQQGLTTSRPDDSTIRFRVVKTLSRRGPEPTRFRFAGNADCSSSSSTAADAQLSETSRRGRKVCESIFGVRSVAQIPPPSEESPITAPCCKWFRHTEDTNCI